MEILARHSSRRAARTLSIGNLHKFNQNFKFQQIAQKIK